MVTCQMGVLHSDSQHHTGDRLAHMVCLSTIHRQCCLTLMNDLTTDRNRSMHSKFQGHWQLDCPRRQKSGKLDFGLQLHSCHSQSKVLQFTDFFMYILRPY
uniref:Uncharacterized protein n=1 Tax=Cacopsylla melanoneura TaxID=428564 RepID=A0A8D8QLL7_9HEMI